MQLFDRAELLVARHFRVDAVKLPKIDALDAKIAQALLRLLDQIFGTPDRNPLIRTVRVNPPLVAMCTDCVRMQRFADELFGNVGAVGIGGVDEIDAEFRHAPERAQRLRAIGRLAPDTLADDAHRAESQAVDGKLVAELERSGFRCLRGRHGNSFARDFGGFILLEAENPISMRFDTHYDPSHGIKGITHGYDPQTAHGPDRRRTRFLHRTRAPHRGGTRRRSATGLRRIQQFGGEIARRRACRITSIRRALTRVTRK